MAQRALKRDEGPPRRAPEFQVAQLKDASKGTLEPGAMAFPVLTYSLALFFMMRMLELLDLKWTDIVLAGDGSSVAVVLERSKGDQEARGVKRTLGCTCRSSPGSCPVEAVKKLRAAHEDRWPGSSTSQRKVAVTTEGRPTTRDEVLRAWAKAAGSPLQGHSARRSGALFYVRAGLSIPEITFLGRWHSDLVFQYAEEAWADKPWTHAAPRRARPKAKTAPTPSEQVPVEDKDPSLPEAPPPPPALQQVPSQLEVLIDRPKWIKTYGRSKVVHLMDPFPTVCSAQWKTKCGWPFARSKHFTLYAEPPSGTTRCRKCRLHGASIAASQYARSGDADADQGASFSIELAELEPQVQK